jgi:phospholipase/carboxylesterase
MAGSAPRRLLVFLHGAGSSAEAFVPVALAWQLKFPGAAAMVLSGLDPLPGQEGRANWYPPPGGHYEALVERVGAAASEVARRINVLQAETGLGRADTVLVGHDQGAIVALDLARRFPQAGAIVVAYGGRLARPVGPGETIEPTIHLIHGELDSIEPAVHAERALRHLQAAGADVSLDIAIDEAHGIGQALVSLGTTRVMQTLFRGRRPRSPAAGGSPSSSSFPFSHSSETLQ